MATVKVSAPGDLGPALREVRLSEEVTQSALATLADVGRQWLNAFELGDKPTAPLDMVMRVSVALGVTVVLEEAVREPRDEDYEPVDLDKLLDRVTS